MLPHQLRLAYIDYLLLHKICFGIFLFRASLLMKLSESLFIPFPLFSNTYINHCTYYFIKIFFLTLQKFLHALANAFVYL